MTSFNICDKIRYLPTFFGNWTINIKPTLVIMIVKVIEDNGVFFNTNDHPIKKLLFNVIMWVLDVIIHQAIIIIP
jgi:hypothetical protein